MKKKYLSKKEVEHVAWLAHIEISDKEKTLFTGQFNEILDYFKKIDGIDTKNVEATYHVLDINNGARFITYVIAGDRGTGDILLNGAAARLGQIGDQVIILSYGQVSTPEAEKFEAMVVFVDENNILRK